LHFTLLKSSALQHILEGRAIIMKKLAVIFIVVLLFTMFLSASAASVANAAFPEKPIRLIVGSGAGGGMDMSARALNAVTAKYFDKPVVVELMPGASGGLAMDYVARSNPDGYNILIIANAQITYLPSHESDLGMPDVGMNYGDLEPLCYISDDPMIIVANPKTGWKTLAEMVDYVKAHPGEVTYATAGLWTVPHVGALQFLGLTGLDMIHVPLSGGGATGLAVANGDVQMTLATTSTISPYLESGNAVPLAVTTYEPWKNDTSIPTLKSLGYDMNYASWTGLFIPKGVPAEAKNYLEEKFLACLRDEGCIELINKMGAIPRPLGREDFGRLYQAEVGIAAKVIEKYKNSN
jgi:tripartite-type tricarboxylate transporter receptor subunit TctC